MIVMCLPTDLQSAAYRCRRQASPCIGISGKGVAEQGGIQVLPVFAGQPPQIVNVALDDVLIRPPTSAQTAKFGLPDH
jgi:hypothetical protein